MHFCEGKAELFPLGENVLTLYSGRGGLKQFAMCPRRSGVQRWWTADMRFQPHSSRQETIQSTL
jgi:hypothetical protein